MLSMLAISPAFPVVTSRKYSSSDRCTSTAKTLLVMSSWSWTLKTPSGSVVHSSSSMERTCAANQTTRLLSPK